MLDLTMPVMTGEEFLKALLTNGSLLQSNLGAREILKKPIDINDLYRIAEQYN